MAPSNQVTSFTEINNPHDITRSNIGGQAALTEIGMQAIVKGLSKLRGEKYQVQEEKKEGVVRKEKPLSKNQKRKQRKAEAQALQLQTQAQVDAFTLQIQDALNSYQCPTIGYLRNSMPLTELAGLMNDAQNLGVIKQVLQRVATASNAQTIFSVIRDISSADGLDYLLDNNLITVQQIRSGVMFPQKVNGQELSEERYASFVGRIMQRVTVATTKEGLMDLIQTNVLPSEQIGNCGDMALLLEKNFNVRNLMTIDAASLNLSGLSGERKMADQLAQIVVDAEAKNAGDGFDMLHRFAVEYRIEDRIKFNLKDQFAISLLHHAANLDDPTAIVNYISDNFHETSARLDNSISDEMLKTILQVRHGHKMSKALIDLGVSGTRIANIMMSPYEGNHICGVDILTFLYENGLLTNVQMVERYKGLVNGIYDVDIRDAGLPYFTSYVYDTINGNHPHHNTLQGEIFGGESPEFFAKVIEKNTQSLVKYINEVDGDKCFEGCENIEECLQMFKRLYRNADIHPLDAPMLPDNVVKALVSDQRADAFTTLTNNGVQKTLLQIFAEEGNKDMVQFLIDQYLTRFPTQYTLLGSDFLDAVIASGNVELLNWVTFPTFDNDPNGHKEFHFTRYNLVRVFDDLRPYDLYTKAVHWLLQSLKADDKGEMFRYVYERVKLLDWSNWSPDPQMPLGPQDALHDVLFRIENGNVKLTNPYHLSAMIDEWNKHDTFNAPIICPEGVQLNASQLADVLKDQKCRLVDPASLSATVSGSPSVTGTQELSNSATPPASRSSSPTPTESDSDDETKSPSDTASSSATRSTAQTATRLKEMLKEEVAKKVESGFALWKILVASLGGVLAIGAAVGVGCACKKGHCKCNKGKERNNEAEAVPVSIPMQQVVVPSVTGVGANVIDVINPTTQQELQVNDLSISGLSSSPSSHSQELGRAVRGDSPKKVEVVEAATRDWQRQHQASSSSRCVGHLV